MIQCIRKFAPLSSSFLILAIRLMSTFLRHVISPLPPLPPLSLSPMALQTNEWTEKKCCQFLIKIFMTTCSVHDAKLSCWLFFEKKTCDFPFYVLHLCSLNLCVCFSSQCFRCEVLLWLWMKQRSTKFRREFDQMCTHVQCVDATCRSLLLLLSFPYMFRALFACIAAGDFNARRRGGRRIGGRRAGGEAKVSVF